MPSCGLVIMRNRTCLFCADNGALNSVTLISCSSSSKLMSALYVSKGFLHAICSAYFHRRCFNLLSVPCPSQPALAFKSAQVPCTSQAVPRRPLELTRFDGHHIVKSRRSPDESQPQSQTAVSAAVSPADGRTGWCRQKAQRARQRIWLS